MKNFEEVLGTLKLAEILEKRNSETCKKVLWALAIIGAVTTVAGIAYAVYKYLTPEDLDDFDDDFAEDFDEDFYDNLEKEEAKEEEN